MILNVYRKYKEPRRVKLGKAVLNILLPDEDKAPVIRNCNIGSETVKATEWEQIFVIQYSHIQTYKTFSSQQGKDCQCK